MTRPPFPSRPPQNCEDAAPIGNVLDQALPEVLAPPASSLSASQELAWEQLEAIHHLYFGGTFVGKRIRPRLVPLIAGPTGSGKSWLVRTFAEAHGRPLLRLDVAGWKPRGAREGPSTVQQIAEFISRHSRMVIQLDELDKMGSFEKGGEWTTSLLVDAFGLLDRTLFRSYGQDAAALTARLEADVFLVGSGTWQDTWGRPQVTSLGFSTKTTTSAERIRLARAVPAELLSRFHSSLVVLEPPTAAELYRLAEADGLVALARKLDMPIDFTAGEGSGLGIRWLEGIATDLLVRSWRIAEEAKRQMKREFGIL